MKKIVIIGQWTFPKNKPRAFRCWELAKEFAKEGFDVVQYALLGNYDYGQEENANGLRIKNLGKSFLGMENSDDKPIGNISLPKRILLRLCNDANSYVGCEIYNMIRMALKREGDIDLLITVAFPHTIHWATSFFINREKVKCWIADCGDPFMGNPYFRHPFWGRWLEKRWCRKADYITIPIENGKSAYYEEFVEKIKVIPQGFDLDAVKISSYEKHSVPTFAYAGKIYVGKRDPFGFIEYIRDSKLDVKFVIYSDHPSLINLSSHYPFVEVRKPIARSEILKQLSKFDFLINILNDGSVQSPSKLIDYTLSQRPILNISTKPTESQIETFNEFIGGCYEKQYKVPNIEDYNIKNVCKKFIDLAGM